MCRPPRAAVVALLLLAGTGRGLGAQSAAVWRDSAAVLSRQVRALRDSILQGDSSVREVARRGNLVVGASPPWRGTASAALEKFDRVRRRWFGDELPSPGGFRIALRSEKYYGSWGSRWGDRELGIAVLAGLPDTGASVRTERNAAEHQIADLFIDLYAEMMWASAGLTGWLEHAPPLSMSERERRYLAMYAVVTRTGRAQRGCIAGDPSDCAYVLGLRPPFGENPGGVLPSFVRTDLLLTALDLGGAGAWARLREAGSGGIEPALVAAAEMPLDSLLVQWQRSILAWRPTEGPLGAGGAALLVGWSAVLLAGTLTLARIR